MSLWCIHLFFFSLLDLRAWREVLVLTSHLIHWIHSPLHFLRRLSDLQVHLLCVQPAVYGTSGLVQLSLPMLTWVEVRVHLPRLGVDSFKPTPTLPILNCPKFIVYLGYLHLNIQGWIDVVHNRKLLVKIQIFRLRCSKLVMKRKFMSKLSQMLGKDFLSVLLGWSERV